MSLGTEFVSQLVSWVDLDVAARNQFSWLSTPNDCKLFAGQLGGVIREAMTGGGVTSRVPNKYTVTMLCTSVGIDGSTFFRSRKVLLSNYSQINSNKMVFWYDDFSRTRNNTQWASCQIRKIADAHAPGMPGTFSPRPPVSDPDMHHGTCVTHVPWCMLGSLTNGFLWSRSRGKTFPAFPAHAQPTTLRIWKEANGDIMNSFVIYTILIPK